MAMLQQQQEMRELAAEMEAKCGLKLPEKIAIFVGDLNPFDAAQLVLDFAQPDQPVDVLCPYGTAPELAHMLLDRGREFVSLPFVFALFSAPADALQPFDRMAIEHALRDAVTLVFAVPLPGVYASDAALLWAPRLLACARAEGAAFVLVAPDAMNEISWDVTARESGANLHPHPSPIPSGWRAATETRTGAPRPATRATAVDAELARGASILERSLSDSHEALAGVLHSAGDLVAFFAEINLVARGELPAQLAPHLGPWDFRERVLSATGGIPISHAQLVRHASFIAQLNAGASPDLQHYALQLHSVWVDFQPITSRDPLGPHKLYFYLAPAPRTARDLFGGLLDLWTGGEHASVPLDKGALITALVENYKPTRDHYTTLCGWSNCCTRSHAACDHDRASCYCGLRVPEVWCVEAMLTAVAESCDAAQAARHLRTSSLFELLSPQAVQFIGSSSAQELADLRELLARSQLGRSLCSTITTEGEGFSAEASASASSSSSEFAVELGQSRVLCHPERISTSRRIAHITSGEIVIYIGSRVSSHREVAALYESGGIRVLYQDPSAGCVVQLAPLAAPGRTADARVDETVARLIHDFADLRHTLQGGGVWLGRPRPDPNAFERLLASTVPGTHPTAALRAFLRPSTAALAFKPLFSKTRVLRAFDAETSTLAPADWLDLLRFDLLRIYVPGRLATVAMCETLLKFRARILREERADWTDAVTAWLGDSDSGPELCQHFHQDLRELSRTLATEEEEKEEKRPAQAPPAASKPAATTDLLAALWAPRHVNPRQLRADLACLLAEPELLSVVPYLPYARDTLVGAWLELESARGPLRERYAALAGANLPSDNIQRYRALFPAV